ncbi:hypothetical protein J8L88_10540 [Aquimarina sp. MMG015]|uniref:hypothetical protein n=1 Tax=Aquimarina TaxID=290174 RepID=UPI0012DD6CA3|nr:MULTISPECIES: hypothetical protein [Aquimarina]MBQ4803286.1 hypothetical protein [Aquimarina sp. MMG015]
MSIAAMVASIKFNDRRNRREAFSNISGTIDTKSQGIKIEPVSEETLKEIRDKLKKQRLTVFKKQLIVSVFLVVLITSFIIYIV